MIDAFIWTEIVALAGPAVFPSVLAGSAWLLLILPLWVSMILVTNPCSSAADEAGDAPFR